MTKTAVVTGAASGIGRECVTNLLQDGWMVFALDVSRSMLEELRQFAVAPPGSTR